jgi:hypothetical protein
MKNNRRKYTRLMLEFESELILDNGIKTVGKAKNISFGGINIEFKNMPSIILGMKCRISFSITGDEKNVVMFECEVIRIQTHSISLRFDAKSEKDYYDIFKNIMLIKSPDPDKVLKELDQE